MSGITKQETPTMPTCPGDETGTSAPIMVATFDEFAASRGVGKVLNAADMSFIRAAGNTSAINLCRAQQAAHEATGVTLEARNKLRSEYADLVSKGQIRPPTRQEQLIKTAQGHPDNLATQAARRILDKQGIAY